MKEEEVKHSYKTVTSVGGSAIVLLLMLGLFAACGGSGGTSNSNTTSGTTMQGGGDSTSGQTTLPAQTGIAGNTVTGTITKYNSSTKQLTLKLSNGSTETLSVGQAMIMKSQKITTNQLSALLKTSGMTVRFTGKEQSTNTYLAQEIMVSSMSGTSMGGNPPTNGTPSAIGGSGGMPGSVPPTGGTPPTGNGVSGSNPSVNGTPPSGSGSMPGGNPPTGGTPVAVTNPNTSGTPQSGASSSSTPRTGVSTGSNAGQMMLSNVVMKTNQLVGKTMEGQSVTLNLDSSTVILHQTAGTTSDLQVGETVTAILAQVVSNTSTNAQMLIIGTSM